MPDAVVEALASLNLELAKNGDPARIRYAIIEPDPYIEGALLACITWELPDPPTDEGWPLEVEDKYCSLVQTRLADLVPWTECLFRTTDELVEDAKLGSEVPAPAA